MGELGRIKPVKAYQTTDGKKFVGPTAKEDAEDHQRWLNEQKKDVMVIKKEDLPKRRLPVAQKPSQTFKPKKGKGSYKRKPKHPKR